jgi:protein TonB
MKKLFFVIIFLLSLSGFAQDAQNDSIYSISEVDKKPEFNGGVNKFNRFIVSNFRCGEQRKFYGKIITEFVVEKDGSLSNFKTINDFGFGSGAEAIRVLKLSPNWLPAEKNGKNVRSIYIFPLEINKSK